MKLYVDSKDIVNMFNDLYNCIYGDNGSYSYDENVGVLLFEDRKSNYSDMFKQYVLIDDLDMLS